MNANNQIVDLLLLVLVIHHGAKLCKETTKGSYMVQRIENIVLYCIMRPYTDGPIGPLSYRHSSGVVRNPHSTLAE